MPSPGADAERGVYWAVIFAAGVAVMVATGWAVWCGCEWCWDEFVAGVG